MTILLGNDTLVSAASDSITTWAEAFQFTAVASGTLDTIRAYETTQATAGVTGVWLGVYADSANAVGALLGQAQYVGRPAASAWYAASGLSVPITSGVKYWLGLLNVGSGSSLTFNVGNAGALRRWSSNNGMADLSLASGWSGDTNGPASIWGDMTTPATPSAAPIAEPHMKFGPF